MGKITKKQSGIGLIEVLVALLVVAMGILGLTKLQGNLLKSSGDAKAHSEALALAQEKIESFRDSVTLAEFNAISSGSVVYGDDASEPTTSAIYNIAWTVTDESSFTITGTPARKEISVNVSWLGVDGTTQNVYAQTELAWIDPGKRAVSNTADYTSVAVPSPRQNASEDVASEGVFSVPESTISTGTPGVSSSLTLTSITSLLPDANDNYPVADNVALTQIAPNSYFYATDNPTHFFVEPGIIAVFLCQGSTCKYIQNHFGGVVHRISGKVSSMSGELLSNIRVVWSSSDVNACYQDSTYSETTVNKTGYTGNSSTMQSMHYECVLAGNCDATSSSDGIGTGNGCSVNVTDADIASRNVGPGGEFGEVGVLGVDDQGGFREQLCFLEDTADYSLVKNVLTNTAATDTQYVEAYLLPVTKRSYVTRRRNTDNSESSEGINRSFTNHNFLLLDRATAGGTSETCADLVALNAANDNFEVAPRKIVRTLSTGNSVAGEENYAGGTGPATTLVGTVSAATGLNVYVSTTQANNTEPGSCYVKSDSTAYACVVPSTTTSVTIEAGNSTTPSAKTAYSTCSSAVVSSATPTLATACDWTGDFTSPP